jgi:hypothetical protein
VAKTRESHTGHFLARTLAQAGGPARKRGRKEAA